MPVMLETTACITSVGCTVEIAIALWPKPIEYNWRDGRAVLTMIDQPSSYRAEGHYSDGPAEFSSIGSIFLVPPNHELLGRGPGGRHRVLRCLFDPAVYAPLVEPLASLTEGQLNRTLDIGTTMIVTLMRRLAREALAPGLSGELLVQSLGAALLVECNREIFESCLTEKARHVDFSRSRCVELVDNCIAACARFPHVKEIARLCGTSCNRLEKRFHRETGQTIGRYLADIRLAHAEHLLADPALPLKEIAFRLGYANTANFATSFKALSGQSPMNYRHARQFI
jgi:AraC family transcriptional regulator